MTALKTEFFIEDYLALERDKDLLRLSTAGSVDDGKSTLIGRLLYDTQTVYDDQLRAIEGKGTTAPGQIDFALLTDGLRAEREQGITIDVAYRYFSTATRKFIIADTPGHEQYTRNMATGASTADAAVVLVDATKGALVQSLRHAYIASLLRVKSIVIAVNKMDLVEYHEETFRNIAAAFTQQLEHIAKATGNTAALSFIPVSALLGDNVVHPSTQMTWYDGPTLLGQLESLSGSAQQEEDAPFRFPVQRVLRPSADFRGFAGQIASGKICQGDTVAIFPSGTEANVARIVTFDGDLQKAGAPLSVTLVLDREVDVSRGDTIVARDTPPQLAHRISASLVWMDQRPLELHRRYLLKHTSRVVPAFVRAVKNRVHIETLEDEPADTLNLNEIGTVEIQLLRTLVFDPYNDNRVTGSLILIDAESNATVASGMIRSALGQAEDDQDIYLDQSGPVTAKERSARWGHRGALLELRGPEYAINTIERTLFSLGIVASRLDASALEGHEELLRAVVEVQTHAGILAILVRHDERATLVASIEGQTEEIEDRRSTAAAVYRLLQKTGVVFDSQGAGI